MEAFNIEQKILNKQPKHIAYITDMIGGAVESLKGTMMGTSGSSSTGQHGMTTAEQQQALKDAIKGTKDFQVDKAAINTTGPFGGVAYTAPTNQVTTPQAVQTNVLTDEGALSLEGVEKMRTTNALAQVNPQVEQLQKLAGGLGGDRGARTQQAIGRASRELGYGQVAAGREHGGGGARNISAEMAAQKLLGEQFAETVGRTYAAEAEGYEVERAGAAGQLLSSAGQLGISGQNLNMQTGQNLAQLNLEGAKLASQVGLSNVSNLLQGQSVINEFNLKNAQSEAQTALQSGQITVEQFNQINQAILAQTQQYQNASLAKLGQLGSLGTTQTLENITTVEEGQEGLLPGIIGAAGAIGGGMATGGTGFFKA